MHCTLSRTQSDISAISDRPKSSLPLKHLGQHHDTTLEDCMESPVIWQNTHDSCTLLTFLTLESDGNWKILALPMQSHDNNNNPPCVSQYDGHNSSGCNGRSQPHGKAMENSKLLSDNKVDGTVRSSTSKSMRKKGKQSKKHISDGGSAEISLLPSYQNDQGNVNGDGDLSGAILLTSDHSVSEDSSIFQPEDLLKANDIQFSDRPSSNGSLGSDLVLISSDAGEGFQIDSSASDRETIEVRHKELPNSGTGRRVSNDVINLTDQCKETGRGNNRNAAKKSYRIKTTVKGRGASRPCTFGNSLSHTSHPVWQKVQRKLETEHGLVEGNGKLLEKNGAQSSVDKRQIPHKISGKLKRKQYPCSRQESNQHSRKGPSSNKSKHGNENKFSNSNIVDIPVISSTGNPRDRLKTNDAESLNTEPIHNSHVCPDGLQLNEKSSNCTFDSDNKCTDSSLGESQADPNIMSSTICLPQLLANRVARSDKEHTSTESSRQKSTSVSTAQKWVPVGTKTNMSTVSHNRSCISLGRYQAEVCQEETPIINTRCDSPLLTSKFESDDSLHKKGPSEPTENHNIAEEQNLILNFHSSLPGRLGQLPTDLDRIAMAVDHACMAQLASEALQIATGGPIAEFERLLHLSSPVLYISHSISSCNMCPRNHSSPLCLHERPGIPLGYLWEWYQKHGNFGLEVQGKDYNNSKRLGIDRFSFRAYFVPYLSAVQLFGTGKKQTRINLSEDSTIDEKRENSTVSHLPIFPLLIPRAPRDKNDEMASHSFESDKSYEADLIFEYFELEQPQQRRPLHEKIQELIRGDGPSQSKPYGDPSKLHSISVQDLDPRSWYSVAWYPIYRIPDGNFSAAFLTYHSLGHLVRRNGAEDCVMSPVVGLQSYNAQGECWLQLRPSIVSQTSEIASLDPSKILKERLRTLEEAASSMSRATVSKGGDGSSVNRHPDYEFFLSRRQYY
ncbi:hypothetical protein SAY86_006341 [Trapa natans]|uniref:Uncharacterized protein n=1 Tax=Trapa natans TaxID=22666 RepID=A0AAN7KYM8_TRANT|nr:hypothetical protein SAY86_006341 [Trapa natans]